MNNDVAGAPRMGLVGAGEGSGASTLAVALAVRAARAGLSTVLIDGDPDGGGLDVLLGLETETGLRWPDIAGAHGGVDGHELLDRLPAHPDGPAVLSHGRSSAALPPDLLPRAVTALGAVCDLLLLDLPRWRADPVAVDLQLFVVRGSVRAAAAAGVLGSRSAHPGRAVVVRDATALCSQDIADTVGAPLLARIDSERHLDRDLERGTPPATRRRSALARACDRILTDVLDRVEPAGEPDGPATAPVAAAHRYGPAGLGGRSA